VKVFVVEGAEVEGAEVVDGVQDEEVLLLFLPSKMQRVAP